MNLLLLSESDTDGAGRASLRDDRVRHIDKVLGKGVGDEIRVGVVDGPIGRGRIVSLDRDLMELEVSLDEAPPPSLGVDLVLALPRPKFVGRIVQAIASFGVDRLTLLHTARVQKSYWQSSVLAPASIDRCLRLGLEQAVATSRPQVDERRHFADFVREELPGRLALRPGLVADVAGPVAFPRSFDAPRTLIVGPEGGLLDDEIERLGEAGAEVASLGPRILKVEVAVAACLSRCLPDAAASGPPAEAGE